MTEPSVAKEPSVEWVWELVKTSNLEKITELNLHSKQLQLVLNQAGVATGWLHLLDENAKYIEELKTSLLCSRNGVPIWSGPIYKCNEASDASTEQLQITAYGWFKRFEKRNVHTGYEWAEMLAKSGKAYTPLSTESALELFYTTISSPPATFSTIAADLINRANIDVPTGITIGLVPATNSINLKVAQFHPIGELITQLTSIESGFDFHIDPVTREFNIYYNTVRGGTVGLGRDRGPGIIFTHPGNCKKAERVGYGERVQNRTEAIGQLNNVGKAPPGITPSIEELGLYEASESLSDVVNTDILIAYAEIQTLTLERPLKIITFEPKAIGPDDVKSNIPGLPAISSVPRPFEDYEIGDIVYTTIEKGNRFIVGVPNPQPVRVFAMTIDIDDDGIERVSNIQTTYTA
jgi:hypothetical protein